MKPGKLLTVLKKNVVEFKETDTSEHKNEDASKSANDPNKRSGTETRCEITHDNAQEIKPGDGTTKTEEQQHVCQVIQKVNL